MDAADADLAELLDATRRGDAAASERLEVRLRRELSRFCAGYVGPSDADDAVQEVFRRLLRSETTPAKPRVWIFTVARNVCLNQLRGRGRRIDDATLRTGIDRLASATGPATRLAREEDAARALALMRALPEEQREVLMLRYVEELSRDEIAEILVLSTSVVKSRLYEGMKKLREGMGPGREPE